MTGSTSIFVGSNEFVDCTDIISIGGTSLFSFSRVEPSLLITVSIPAPALGIRLEARDNVPVTMKDDFRVDAGASRVEAFWRGTSILLAEHRPEGVRVEFDFRPLGLDLWTENGALNIGGSKLVNNRIQHAGTGIAIGA